ncbi:C40 family peptidase [Neobacillus jeddahensis]|uniref:C40 family peptidase n=1 Tax=Neobacillus jeddahensis TaxID=1461580 RepID=UPI0005A84244|nr:C40 family peptidase [Neobacillus jeddahensis]
MENIQRVEIKKINTNHDEYELILYIDDQLTELSSELGTVPIEKRDMTTIANKIVKERFPNVKVTIAKVFIGGIAMASFNLTTHSLSTEAAEPNSTSVSSVQTSSVYYSVASGDTLWNLSVKFGSSVDQIKKANNLTSDVLQVNQHLIIPKAYHTVAVGDYLTVLAKKYGVTVNAIKEANGMTSDDTRLGQTLIIPQIINGQTTAPATNIPQPATQNQASKYTVVAGDSLSVIAKRLGTTVEALRSTNNLTSDIIRVGQVLTIPASANTETQTASTSPTIQEQSKTTSSYSVVSGDSLSVIAKKNNISVDQLKQANQLTSDIIRVGQLLIIPNGQSGINDAPSPTPAVTTIELNDVQKNLKALGYFAVSATTTSGNEDQSTKQAVKTFQGDYGLPVTGNADQATTTAIEHAMVKKSLINDTSRYLGVPYVWGGTTPSGFDCSGFVYYMFKQQGINMTRNTSAGLNNTGIPIDRSHLQPGDLVFFAVNTTGTISHVGFYLGDNQFISATSSKGIAAASIDSSYWGKYYVGAKRVY